MPTLRPARPADVPALVEHNRLLALESESLVLDPTVLRLGVAAAVECPDKGRYFLAEEAQQVVGQLMVTREWSDWRNGWMWWIQSVYVREGYRNRGLFRCLFEHVRHEAAKEGAVGLRLYVEKDNVAAQKVYLRLGMVQSDYFVFELCPL